MRRFASSLTWFIVLGLLPGCFATQQDLSTQRQLRLAAQQRTVAVNKENALLWREVARLSGSNNQAVLQLQRRWHQLERQRARQKGALQTCQRGFEADKRPLPHVHSGETRFWEQKHRRLRPQVHKLLTRRLPQIKQCYRLNASHKQPLRGAFWLLYGLSATGIIEPIISQSRWNTGNTQQTARLQGCITALFRSNVPHADKTLSDALRTRLVRVAQLLVLADTEASARSTQPLAFKWPWKQRGGKVGKEREVCRQGPRRSFWWSPRFTRPCAPGLVCCMPCGAGGCDSICLPSCHPRP